MDSFSLSKLRKWLAIPAFSVSVLTAQVSPSTQMKEAPATKTPTATVGTGPTSKILPPPPAYRFPDGQTYIYSVEWHMFTAGIASVKLNLIDNQQHVSALADSSGVVSALFRVHDLFEANFDPHSFCSLNVTKHTEEGAHQRTINLRLNYDRRKSISEERNLKTGELKTTEGDIPACVTDVVSGFYYLASLPLQPGATALFVVNDGRTTEVTAHAEAREQVRVPAGNFQTIRVRVEATSGSLKGKGEVWVWFTDDANHTPVQMRSKLGWGTLLFRLQRVDHQ